MSVLGEITLYDTNLYYLLRYKIYLYKRIREISALENTTAQSYRVLIRLTYTHDDDDCVAYNIIMCAYNVITMAENGRKSINLQFMSRV